MRDDASKADLGPFSDRPRVKQARAPRRQPTRARSFGRAVKGTLRTGDARASCPGNPDSATSRLGRLERSQPHPAASAAGDGRPPRGDARASARAPDPVRWRGRLEGSQPEPRGFGRTATGTQPEGRRESFGSSTRAGNADEGARGWPTWTERLRPHGEGDAPRKGDARASARAPETAPQISKQARAICPRHGLRATAAAERLFGAVAPGRLTSCSSELEDGVHWTPSSAAGMRSVATRDARPDEMLTPQPRTP